MILKLLFAISVATLGLFGSTSDKIAQNKSSLAASQKEAAELNKKLEDLAASILSTEQTVAQTATKITNLSLQVKSLENSAKSASKELNSLTRQTDNLKETQINIEARLIRLIAQNLSFELVTSTMPSEQTIIADEIASALIGSANSELATLASSFSQNADKIADKTQKITSIQTKLTDFRAKEAELNALQNEQRRSLAQLKTQKDSYLKRLQALQKQQDEMRETLNQLQIIQKESAKKTEPKEPAKKQDPAKIRQIGTSYQSSKVRKYTGAKTIAPLDSYSVKQKFGDFIDPVYNIKIFNESVVLRSKEPNARVKSVLEGKIVFAKNTPLLQNVVIVQNANGIHTIYAHLSQIAPGITPGFKVKKGYTIGRVREDLTFEVTQQNYHINPLELIK